MGKGGRPMMSRLRRDIRNLIHETSDDNCNGAEQLVGRLRATIPDYARVKLPVLTMQVKEILNKQALDIVRTSKATNKRKSIRNNGDVQSDKDEDGDSSSPPVNKKMRKVEKNEQNSSESSPEEDGDGEKSVVSTSDDELEIDLTKTMLRSKYSGSNINDKQKDAESKVIREDIGVEKVKKTTGDEADRLLSENGGSSGGGGGDGDEKGIGDLGGMDGVFDLLNENVMIHLQHPEMHHHLDVRPTTGILLHGPPGCGKTTLARAIANEAGIPIFEVSSTELVSGVSGASEKKIRELFSKAYRTAPSIVFIDEIDAIASKRDDLKRSMELRIVTQLMSCMDSKSQRIPKQDNKQANPESYDKKPGYVLVIGATNRPDAIDPALRRPGRFDCEIKLGVPDKEARLHILLARTCHSRLAAECDLKQIARSSPGFVGTDLDELVNKAGRLAIMRTLDGETNEGRRRKIWSSVEMDQKLFITMADLEAAVKLVQPTLKREGFSSIPDVKWEDIGGLDTLREEFDSYIVRRIKYPEEYEGKRRKSATGILLYGPPGCGKTLIAKAVANEAGVNFIYIAGPELLSKYVGESELAVRKLFSRARMCSPCIIFFDEVDALTTVRGKEGGHVTDRVVRQLLTELDGAVDRKDVYVIGATNRPDMIDQALFRPGRFNKLLYVPLPNQDERGLILKALAKEMTLDDEVDLVAIGRSEACANLSGADLSALLDEAEMAAQKEKSRAVNAIHFEHAFRKIRRSVSDKQIKYYDQLSKIFGAN